MNILMEPFAYRYMIDAMWASALIGATCGLLSCFLMLKGWSLIGDALSHSVVPGVAVAQLAGLPFAPAALISGGLAAGAMLLLSNRSGLKGDVVIGLIFTAFFGLGLFIASMWPMAVSIRTITMGNILAITPADSLQLAAIAAVTITVIALRWPDLMLVFFDESHARAVGLNPGRLRLMFFALLAAATVAAMQTVGALLVVALVVTPGATAFLLTDRFSRLLILASAIGAGSSLAGAYLSYFLDGATGGIIVLIQTALFAAAYLAAPRHGLIARRLG